MGPVEIPAQTAATRPLLAELGYVEGRIRLEFRHAAGDADALPALAQEIVRDSRVDVIIAISTPAALAGLPRHRRLVDIGLFPFYEIHLTRRAKHRQDGIIAADVTGRRKDRHAAVNAQPFGIGPG
ncbi:hypothetical protein JQ581_23260 [Bradyrhizobium liaoningense]|uniref:hypothetical protein n=1 Tax=Bradyrhizobium liaoningense TaxID=43992 RepID=UPI001BA80CEF|nr:hypothetical protein [Bradyrhizobium liaoningense]MBR0739859.1 hypothetical protein [Bradyrhizobium liaoningense]